jgi:hypothetical protein
MENRFRSFSGNTSGRAFAQGIKYFETDAEAQKDSDHTGSMYEPTGIKLSNADLIRHLLYPCS